MLENNKVYTIAALGLKGVLVEVEANFSFHLPKVILVGLPDTSVQEARERVWAAIENSDFEFPRGKVVVNLAPAQIRKEGGGYDLAIAVSILQNSGQLQLPQDNKLAFIGELSLYGKLKAVPGILVMVSSLQEMGFEQVFVPEANAREAAIIKGIEVLPVKDLRQLADHLSGKKIITPAPVVDFIPQLPKSTVDFGEVRGQQEAKRVLEIAAAGGHNVLLVGPPGSGKTMLAKAFLSILPPLDLSEALEVSKIYSLAGLLSEDNFLIDQRILRAPHHSASASAIVGGGAWPRPGEISLAHHNVLFFDEILEFPRQVLEALRQPLEDKVITVSRVKGSLDFPADFIFLATANPCPCGYLTDAEKNCHCSAMDVRRYQRRLSGPLLDRIDLHLSVHKVKADDLNQLVSQAENSEIIQRRVISARSRQLARWQNNSLFLNTNMSNRDIKKYCQLDNTSLNLMRQASQKMQLSARGHMKMLKVARTIADLAGRDNIEESDILEAIRYRNKIFEEL